MDTALLNAEGELARLSRLSNRQLLHLRDCAKELVESSISEISRSNEYIASADGFVRRYKKLSNSLALPSEKSFEYGDIVADGFTASSAKSFRTLCRATLCKYICDYAKKSGHPISEGDFFAQEQLPNDFKVAYMKNSYSDVAYRAFSAVLPKSSVIYPSSFAAVCEEVYNGSAGFCILPYETSDEGILPSFRQLIIKYELVQVMSCSVVTDTSSGGMRTTRFALLSKSIHPAILPRSAPRFLKIVVNSPSSSLLSDIYSVAELCSLRHIKSESIPAVWDSERYSYSATFAVSGDPMPFLLYLALEVPESTPDSLYSGI